MSHRFNFPGGPAAPITPMVYVKDKTVWQYKLLARNLAKEEAPNTWRYIHRSNPLHLKL